MKCPHCGYIMPDEEEFHFCEHCGQPMNPPVSEPAPVQEPAPIQEPAPVQAPAPTPEPVSIPEPVPIPESAAYQQPPQPPVPPVQPAAPSPQPVKQHKGHKRFIIPIVILSVLALALTGASLYFFLQYQNVREDKTKLTSQLLTKEQKIEKLNSDLHFAEQESDVLQAERDDLQLQLDDAMGQLLALQDAAEELDRLSGTMDEMARKAAYFEMLSAIDSSFNFGWASDQFHVDNGLVVVPKGDTGRSIRLTTAWEGTGTVSLDFSSEDVAELECAAETWENEVSLRVVPKEEGITLAALTNDVNNEVFYVLIVVTEAATEE